MFILLCGAHLIFQRLKFPVSSLLLYKKKKKEKKKDVCEVSVWILLSVSISTHLTWQFTTKLWNLAKPQIPVPPFLGCETFSYLHSPRTYFFGLFWELNTLIYESTWSNAFYTENIEWMSTAMIIMYQWVNTSWRIEALIPHM